MFQGLRFPDLRHRPRAACLSVTWTLWKWPPSRGTRPCKCSSGTRTRGSKIRWTGLVDSCHTQYVDSGGHCRFAQHEVPSQK